MFARARTCWPAPLPAARHAGIARAEHLAPLDTPEAPRAQRYQYTAPGFGFESELVYDEYGLVLEYPGIAVRAA